MSIEATVTTPAVNCPAGFRAAATTCGLKPSGAPDLALFVSDDPAGATSAAVFTTNRLRAAPVELSARSLRASKHRTRALLINAGNANAATGAEGMRRAVACARSVAEALSCPDESVLVNSTGVIGIPLPHEQIIHAIPELIDTLDAHQVEAAATAMRTTDTTTKTAAITIDGHDGPVTIVGLTKGSGMIHPNMATTIGVLMTDAAIDADSLDPSLRAAIDASYHRISVDGDTSTNDAVYALASGTAGSVDAAAFTSALSDVARSLAMQIVRDGEGASKVITVRARHARTTDEALDVARTVAQSLLVRTAVTGGDPNWGRIVAAACRASTPVDPELVTLTADSVILYDHGTPLAHDHATLAPVFKGTEVVIDLDLGMHGSGEAEFHTCDLTTDYIRINAEYTT